MGHFAGAFKDIRRDLFSFSEKIFSTYPPFHIMKEGAEARPPVHTAVAYLASSKC
jgi:hypothetical protein